MSEVGFFPKYEQKENRVTNYTLLLLKQIYNESPNTFQELIVNLLSGDCNDINVGVNFSQQEGFSCEKGKSIIDGVIRQLPFDIFIETKNSDWFYQNQLERHIENLLKQNGKKVFIALANFDGLSKEQKLFEDIKQKYSNNNDLTIVNIEFEDLKKALDDISNKIKSEVLSIMLKEYEQFLNENDLLPTWKYRLDVVNCAKSQKDVKERLLYICPEAKGAYKHARAKYFGIYENKAVNFIAEIKAVCNVNYDNGKHEIDISWWDRENYSKEEILQEAHEKSVYCWDEPLQMFLLGNFKDNVNFIKDSSGGMFGSKIYFNFNSNIKNLNDLVDKIQNKNWSEFQ